MTPTSSSRMKVMPSNNSGIRVGYLCKTYPDRLGWLIGPGGWRKPPSWMPTALDNGAFAAWKNKTPWDESAWWKLVTKAYSESPLLWAVVPDVVTNKEGTLDAWHKWSPIMRQEFPGLPLAFAVQDGMTPRDVPSGVHTVFVGGSFDWKWDNLDMWTKHFRRVHVARVNTRKRLWQADQAGAVSCDGTGWFQYGDAKIQELDDYLKISDNLPKSPMRVLSDPSRYFRPKGLLAELAYKILNP